MSLAMLIIIFTDILQLRPIGSKSESINHCIIILKLYIAIMKKKSLFGTVNMYSDYQCTWQVSKDFP